MALELRQQLKLSQQLIMTPQLQMAIKLLQLSRLELMDTIQQELEENPALDEIQDTDGKEAAADTEPDKPAVEETLKEVSIDEKLNNDIDWSNYLDEYSSAGRVHFESEKKESTNFDAFIARKESLHDHLLWQLLMTSPTSETEKIGSLIVGNLNRDGYLDTTIEDLAAASGEEVGTVESVLKLMQSFDPSGVCARDLKECLIIQADRVGLDNTLVIDIINNHLKHLENKNYNAIAKELKTNIKNIVSAVNIIKSFEPKPGRLFSEEEPHYITPDIYVHKLGDEFVVMLNDDGMPKLRVNSYYREAIKKGQPITDGARDYVQEKIRSAAWLIRSIHQRQKTIYKVMQSILQFQREFFEKGISCLRPMVLRDVAEDIGMHESTISRVTTNKYAHTPQGIFELKYFFNSSINRIHGGAIASASVQDKIKQIIDDENQKKPYSDEKISEILKAYNISIARRTVAKYREQLKILPSNKRKKF